MQNDLKKFTGAILIFSGVTLISYIFLICLWGDFVPEAFSKNMRYKVAGPGHLYTRLKEVKKVNDLDLLILGSSHAYRGFDTRNFNEAGFNKVFNLGSSAQTPIETKVLLNRYLDKLNPEIIVYEVYPMTFCIDGVESSLDLVSNDKNDIQSLKMTAELGSVKTFNTLLYAGYRDIFNINAGLEEKAKKNKDTYIPGGYVEKEISYYKAEKFPVTEWKFNEKQFKAFEESLALIKKKNIKLVLINAPIAPAQYKAYKNNAEFDKRMKSYGEYYNFNEIMALNDSLDFQDADHLNKNGVKKFNEKLIAMKILTP